MDGKGDSLFRLSLVHQKRAQGSIIVVTMVPSETGPFLQAAFLCEKVLIEANGAKSAIRILDQIVRQATGPNPPTQMEKFAFDMSLVISLKSGAARGTAGIGIRIIKPSSETIIGNTQTVPFEEPDYKGVDLIAGINLEIDQTGTYWFEVLMDGSILSKIPLRIVYLPQRTIGPANP